MKKYKTVTELMEEMDKGTLAQVNKLRKIIMSAEDSLIENIKWNAPNYVFNGEDRITFNLADKNGRVRLILHMGATKKEDKKAKPVLADDSSLVEWNSNIRGTITFAGLDDIQAKQVQLTRLVQKWLALA
jgi:hypothetical protein